MDGSATLGNRPPASDNVNKRFRPGSLSLVLRNPIRRSETIDLNRNVEWQRGITQTEHEQSNNFRRHGGSLDR